MTKLEQAGSQEAEAAHNDQLVEEEIRSRIAHSLSMSEPLSRPAKLPPLLWACMVGDVTTCELILAQGCHVQVNQRAPDGLSALHYAAAALGFTDDEALQVCHRLLDHGADPNFRSEDRLWSGSGLSVHNAAVSVCETGGKSPLHYAAARGHVALCRLLIAYGAEVLLWDHDGLSPADHARMHREDACARYLQSVQQRVYPTYPQDRGVWTVKNLTLHTRRRVVRQRETRQKRMEREVRATVAREFDWKGLDRRKVREIVRPDLYQALQKEEISQEDLVALCPDSVVTLAGGLFQVAIFTDAFCQELLEALERLEVFLHASPFLEPPRRSGAENGMYLNHVGLNGLLTRLTNEVLHPLSKLLFPEHMGEEGSADGFASQHTFLVQYEGGDEALQTTHADNCDVTVNICLGKQGFQGGRLFFYGLRSDDAPRPPILPTEEQPPALWYDHQINRAAIHLGKQYHGAESLEAGHRWNMVLWCRKAAPYAWEALRKSYTKMDSSAWLQRIQEWVKECSHPIELLDSRDPKGSTLLHFSVICGEAEVSRWLLEAGADPYVYDHQGWVPLHYVVSVDDAATLEAIAPFYDDLDVFTLKENSTRLVEINKAHQNTLALAHAARPPALQCAELLKQLAQSRRA